MSIKPQLHFPMTLRSDHALGLSRHLCLVIVSVHLVDLESLLPYVGERKSGFDYLACRRYDLPASIGVA